MTVHFDVVPDKLPETMLADYEAKLKDAGYYAFEYSGDWYYNEINAGDEFCDGPYASRAEVLYTAVHNLHLVDKPVTGR
jgi:hypothetical protein